MNSSSKKFDTFTSFEGSLTFSDMFFDQGSVGNLNTLFVACIVYLLGDFMQWVDFLNSWKPLLITFAYFAKRVF